MKTNLFDCLPHFSGQSLKNLFICCLHSKITLSAESACISQVIPSIKALRSFLTADSVEGADSFRLSLIEQIDQRFYQLEQNSIYTCATFLDPRFKCKFFSENVQHSVKAELHLLFVTQNSNDDEVQSLTLINPLVSNAKRKRSTFSDFFDEMFASPTVSPPNLNSNLYKEFEQYLSEPLLTRDQSCIIWWQANRNRFPFLSRFARSFLSAPSTSVPSESTFSAAGDIITDHRSRLLPENAQMLVFLKENSALFSRNSI